MKKDFDKKLEVRKARLKQIELVGKVKKMFGLELKTAYHESVNVHVATMTWDVQKQGHIDELGAPIKKRMDVFCDHETIGMYLECTDGSADKKTIEIQYAYTQEDELWELLKSRDKRLPEVEKAARKTGYRNIWVDHKKEI